MYDVWIATENNGRFKPVTRVPQEHKTVEEAFLCAGRMVKLLGAEFLTAKNCNVFGVHPTNCIAVYDPHTETAVGEPSAALIVGATLMSEDDSPFDGEMANHTTHTWN